MLAFLPSLITLVVSVLAQMGAPDLVAAHPNAAISLATFAAILNHLLPSPVQTGNPTLPPAVLKTLGALLIVGALFAPQAMAQTVSVDLAKAKLAWDWTVGLPPIDGNPDSFKMNCGKASKTYTVSTPINDPLARSVSIRQVIPSQGPWFCAVTALNSLGESTPSNEVSFIAGALPAGPTNNRVQAQ